MLCSVELQKQLFLISEFEGSVENTIKYFFPTNVETIKPIAKNAIKQQILFLRGTYKCIFI